MDELIKALSELHSIDTSKFIEPTLLEPSPIEKIVNNIGDIEPVDFEETVVGEINKKLEKQNELVSKELKILSEQNRLLGENYEKLKDLYLHQVEINKTAQKELEKSKKYNRWMMIIAIIAMFAAIAGPIVTILI